MKLKNKFFPFVTISLLFSACGGGGGGDSSSGKNPSATPTDSTNPSNLVTSTTSSVNIADVNSGTTAVLIYAPGTNSTSKSLSLENTTDSLKSSALFSATIPNENSVKGAVNVVGGGDGVNNTYLCTYLNADSTVSTYSLYASIAEVNTYNYSCTFSSVPEVTVSLKTFKIYDSSGSDVTTSYQGSAAVSLIASKASSTANSTTLTPIQSLFSVTANAVSTKSSSSSSGCSVAGVGNGEANISGNCGDSASVMNFNYKDSVTKATYYFQIDPTDTFVKICKVLSPKSAAVVDFFRSLSNKIVTSNVNTTYTFVSNRLGTSDTTISPYTITLSNSASNTMLTSYADAKSSVVLAGGASANSFSKTDTATVTDNVSKKTTFTDSSYGLCQTAWRKLTYTSANFTKDQIALNYLISSKLYTPAVPTILLTCLVENATSGTVKKVNCNSL